MNLTDIVTIIAFASAVLTAVAAILTTVAASRRQKQLTEATDAIKFESALRTDSLKVVGAYLYDTVGRFSLDDYLADDVTQARVTSVLQRIEGFVGAPESPIKPQPETLVGEPKITGPLQAIRVDIERGEVWNALARLRRTIELRLREIARNADLPQAQQRGAGTLLRGLIRQQLIPQSLEANLSYAINVANRAIHGLDVSQEEADQAVRQAAIALDTLSMTK